jgi:hypothetical protein
MATKKIDVKEQATTTVDGLPLGAPISDSDTLMVMQGDGSRKTVKVDAKAVKDYVSNGGGSTKEFIMLSGSDTGWSIPTKTEFATVVINTSIPDSFAIKIPNADFKIGTEIELMMYTATKKVMVVPDPAVILNTPTGNILPRDGKATLIYVGKFGTSHTWLLRQDYKPTYPGEPFEVKSITADNTTREIIVEYGGDDSMADNIQARLSLSQSMSNPIVLHDTNKKYTDKVWLSTKNVPDGKYFAQAAAFRGSSKVSDWTPIAPIQVTLETPFAVLEGRAFVASKSIQVRVEGVNTDTDSVECRVSYEPDMKNFFSLTGGDLINGWYIFNGRSLVTSKDLYLQASRWRDGKVDSPYVPDPPLLVKWES